ncbi:hypothetical protein AU255_11185 [Methyloprofundus sedimenti]|uniref:Alpha/beta hydrolase n=1 Tax=Methyloprofundus sedimenti TaxID=1420851 RepID=A0A1V8MA03_9GAMM|nr:hypothetical protein [Methyloprofundus sedimenti]OQK18348.1 hypothetical protein AU255_11185 [Methyloprofundus sedimenti]
MKKLILFSISLTISGCASFGEGIATAVLKKQEQEDVRACKINGKSFPGMQNSLEMPGDTVKVLMVHGVGTHVPGYSTQFQEKLAAELNLTVKSSRYKEINLVDTEFPDTKLGILRVRRLLNEDQSQEMLFYELTWSAITNPEKEKIKYDTSGEYSYDRAEVNQMLKQFSNDTSPDPMIYQGKSHDEMLASFRKAFCWMVGRNWGDLPETSNDNCVINKQAIKYLPDDEYAIVSHSLGSRIVMDGMQSIANRVSKVANGDPTSIESQFIKGFQRKQIPFYLMSNQLPLLEMGQKPPEVINQKDQYCIPGSEHYEQRLVDKTSIMAFSDPNDLLSYAIPQQFVQSHLDSRLCAEVTNININVAPVIDMFGMGSFANPLTAHTGYDSDDRVVALIAKGIGTKNMSELVKERCRWTEFVD